MSDVVIDPPARSRQNLVSDFTAGLTTGVADIPDAMASAILAGANPVQGLYAIMIGTPPVSYTHLDVYKRQPLSSLGEPGLTVVLIQRRGVLIPCPAADTTVETGDTIFIVGLRRKIMTVAALL